MFPTFCALKGQKINLQIYCPYRAQCYSYSRSRGATPGYKIKRLSALGYATLLLPIYTHRY
ncbi:hypothetical protein HMPREF9445_00348 [Bacteroides clarus YIT 12056]|uniref:Uncharacterized protein n=1 Tax=Bacteroides clarus YIT 12056 TaxID=762984 RepID=A0ABP2KV82_9BACE|nr:hypothetical protein HMPREF9445_00348 [Bacteroides clarus YIT 12056]